MFLAARRYGTLRFVTPTDSVAAAKSNVSPEIFRAITRTVLLVQGKRSHGTHLPSRLLNMLCRGGARSFKPTLWIALTTTRRASDTAGSSF